MAKQLVNPIERHAEKAVLGLAGLILLGVIAKYLVTSPNQIELGNEPVTPGTIDDRLAKKAETVRQALRSQQPRLPEFIPSQEEFTKLLHPFTTLALGTQLPAAQWFGPEVPRIDIVQGPAERARPAEVVKLDKPKLTSGRMLTDGGQVVDWVTASSAFDRKRQTELLQKAYGLKWADVVFGPMELQRREPRPDGSWSDADWAAVDCFPVASIPPLPPVPLTDDGKKVTVRKEDYGHIEKFIGGISAPAVQLGCLRPLPPREVNPTWKFPVLTNVKDVALQEDEYINPDASPAPNPPLSRFPGMDEAPKGPRKAAEPAAEEDPSKRLDKATQMLREVENAKVKDEDKIRAILAVCSEVLKDQATLKPDVVEKAQKAYDKARAILKDIEYGPEQGEGAGGKPTTKTKRVPLPVQQVWAHDARQDSLVNGKTYQYRMRAVILNRLVGLPEKFEDPKDAAEIFLKGGWSDPSDPVRIEPASQYFVLKADETKSDVQIEVYQWYRGVWVTSKKKFKIGEALDWTDRAPTPDPKNRDEVYQAPVRFAPGVSVVDIDFNRRMRERKPERGGVKILAPDKTASVVFIDPAGRLHERFEVADKNDPVKRDLRENRVWKAPKPASEP